MKKIKYCVCEVVFKTIEVELTDEEVEEYVYPWGAVGGDLIEVKYDNDEFELIETEKETYFLTEDVKDNFIEHGFEPYQR